MDNSGKISALALEALQQQQNLRLRDKVIKAAEKDAAAKRQSSGNYYLIK